MKQLIIIIMILVMASCSEDINPFNEDGGLDSDADTDTDVVDTDCSDNGVCSNSPKDQCADEDYLMVYTGEATCINEECHYAYELEPCPWGCLIQDGDDECGPSPCDDYVCNNPPDPYCSNNLTLQHFETPGVCILDEGNQPYCDYAEGESEVCEVDLGCEDNGDGTGQCNPGETGEFHDGCFCATGNTVECGPYTVAACEYAGLTCASDSTGAWCE